MSDQDSAPTETHNPTPLPVAAVIRGALTLCWQKRQELLSALLFSGLLLAVFDTVSDHLADQQTGAFSKAAVTVVWSLVFTLFAVTCHRIVLLPDNLVPRFGILRWTRRETRFVGWSVVGFLCLVAVFAIVGGAGGYLFGAASVATELNVGNGPAKLGTFLFGVALMAPGVYVMTRLAVLLPATAIDERPTINWAWDLTAANGWRLTFVTFVLPMLLSAPADLLEPESIGGRFLLNLLSTVALAIGIVALSVSFRFLSEAKRANHEAGATTIPTLG